MGAAEMHVATNEILKLTLIKGKLENRSSAATVDLASMEMRFKQKSQLYR